jgi:hypothetical protein
MNWKLATRSQLIEIAYYDKDALLQHRLAAAVELKRRARRSHGRLQYREKAVYPQ